MTVSVEYLIFAEFLLRCVASYWEVHMFLQADELWEMATVVAVTEVMYYNMLQGGLQISESIS